MNNLTKQNIEDIVKCINRINTLDFRDDKKLLDLRLLISGVLTNLLEGYFGKHNTNLLWNYSIESSSPFNNFEELYEYLSDPYSILVSSTSALSLDKLCSKFPDEKMFKKFQIFINSNPNS